VSPITGPRTLEQLESAIAALDVQLDVQLDEPTLGRLDEIFPGYKTAPEAYAW
jgi:aryl-alcohol dehydrogenase-like predicted oxidoreductase